MDAGTTTRPPNRFSLGLSCATVVLLSVLASRNAYARAPGGLHSFAAGPATPCLGLVRGRAGYWCGATCHGGALASRTKVTHSGASPPNHAAVSRRRLGTRRLFQGTLHPAMREAGNGPRPVGLWGLIVAPREAVPAVGLLGAERTRGPPPDGDRTPRPFDGARDRPAPHTCASPPSPTVPPHPSQPINPGKYYAIKTWFATPGHTPERKGKGLRPQNWRCRQFASAICWQSICQSDRTQLLTQRPVLRLKCSP